MAPFTKEGPASTLTDKDDGKVSSTDKIDEKKADADDLLMPATPTQEGLTPEHPVQGNASCLTCMHCPLHTMTAHKLPYGH